LTIWLNLQFWLVIYAHKINFGTEHTLVTILHVKYSDH